MSDALLSARRVLLKHNAQLAFLDINSRQVHAKLYAVTASAKIMRAVTMVVSSQEMDAHRLAK